MTNLDIPARNQAMRADYRHFRARGLKKQASLEALQMRYAKWNISVDSISKIVSSRKIPASKEKH